MKYNKLSLMSHDLQDFEQEMKRTIEKYINSNFCFNKTQADVPKCDTSQKSSLSTTCSNFKQVGMPVSLSTEKGFFQNFQSPSFNYEANNYGQNYNFMQNFQNKIAYDNLINYFQSKVAASTYSTPYPHNYNFGNSYLNHNQNFNFSGVAPCPYVNNMYGQFTCQPNDFSKFGNFQYPHLLNTNNNSDTRCQDVNNNINNIIGTINSKNENTTKSEETTEEKLILNNKRKRETNPKVEDNQSEDSSSNFKNSRKITKCPHTDQKHYAKNMCNNCYHSRGRAKRAWNCKHTDKFHYSFGLCQNCYQIKYCKKRRVSDKKKEKLNEAIDILEKMKEENSSTPVQNEEKVIKNELTQ